MAKKFVAERGAFERTTISHFFYDAEKDKERQLRTAQENFSIGLDIANYKNFEENSFTPNDKDEVRELVKKMTFPQFKNPLAFLVAYWCLVLNSKEFKIDLDRLKQLKPNDDRGVSHTDILRYARMIYNLKKK